MFHYVASYECARATQARFAVYSQSTVTIFGNFNKFTHDSIAGRAAIREKQVAMLKPGVDEAFSVVDFFIQAHNTFHIVLAKICNIGFGRMQGIAIFDFAFGVRTTKSQKLTGQHPIQVTIFHFLNRQRRRIKPCAKIRLKDR